MEDTTCRAGGRCLVVEGQKTEAFAADFGTAAITDHLGLHGSPASGADSQGENAFAKDSGSLPIWRVSFVHPDEELVGEDKWPRAATYSARLRFSLS